MVLVLLILLNLLMLGFLVLPIVFYRNNATYNVRIKILNEDYNLYKELPKYDDMVYSFKPLNYDYWIKYCENKRNEREV